MRVSDDFLTGTIAAAIGGTTTIVDYVTAYRGEDPMDALATWRRWAEPACVDYGLHMTFTERVPERAIAACVEAGITSFKLYMAYPELLQVDDDVIAEIMRMTRKHGAFVTLHCENGGAIEALRRRALAEGRTGVLEHARTRPAELEAEAVTRAAAHRGARRDERVRRAPVVGARARGGARRARARRRRDRRDVPAVPVSRHRPAGRPRRRVVRVHAAAARSRGTSRSCGTASRPARCRPSPPTTARSRSPTGARARATAPGGYADFTEIPGGLPGIETRMGLVWEGVAAGRITRADWVRLCAEAPARTFGLWPAKGSLRVGRRRRRRGLGPGARPVARRRCARHGRRPLAVSRHDGDGLARGRVRTRRSRRPRRPLRRRTGAGPVRQSLDACVVAAPAAPEADRAQRTAVRDREAVERKVQLLEQVDGKALGPLTFHDRPVGQPDAGLERFVGVAVDLDPDRERAQPEQPHRGRRGR